ncbi:MAG: 30S ribosomal protein S2 [bacterium]
MAQVSDPITIEQLLDNGVHFGHQKKRWNPKMKPFIFTRRGDIHIIDLAQTLTSMKTAFEFIQQIIEQNKTILFVGTKKQVRTIIKEQAIRCGMPYVNTRWLGGTFTNFETIKKSIQRLDRLEARKNTEEFEKLTKKEQTIINKQLEKLLVNLEGIRTLKTTPDAVFIIDTNRDYIAVDEANNKKISIVALVDTNSDPSKVTFPIPANDDAIKSLEFIVTKLADFILLVKQEKAKKVAPAPKE